MYLPFDSPAACSMWHCKWGSCTIGAFVITAQQCVHTHPVWNCHCTGTVLMLLQHQGVYLFSKLNILKLRPSLRYCLGPNPSFVWLVCKHKGFQPVAETCTTDLHMHAATVQQAQCTAILSMIQLVAMHSSVECIPPFVWLVLLAQPSIRTMYLACY